MKIITKSKKSGWPLVNSIIFYLHIIFPVWLMAWMYTSAISMVLLPVAVLTALALGVVYKLVQRFQKGKGILIAARVIAIGAVVAFYLPMVVLVGFKNSKLMYPLKRLDYTVGVFGDNADYYQRLLPEKLPEVCEDYSFVTMGSMVAQDYHPSSYLIFHTDTATLDAYAAYYETLDCKRLESAPDFEPEQENREWTGQDDIDWFCRQMRLYELFQDDLSHAVLYYFHSMYPKGVLLNYETGLVAILT